MTVALVTGSEGWVGRHLRRLLTARYDRVVGIGRRPRSADPAAGYLSVDLRHSDEVSAALRAVRPDVVFHLAASTPQREPDPERLVDGCVGTTRNVCRALRELGGTDGYHPRLVLAGSSAQYGAVPPAQNPITERTLPVPVGAYGHAKAAAEAVAFALAADGRFRVTAARAFNHVGPGESADTVAGALARRVAAVAQGRATRVRAADLDAVRDFTDVRDVARAYADLGDLDATGAVYNVCSGSGVTVRTVLDILLDLAGLDDSVVAAVPGAGAVRRQVGSAAKLTGATGWTARTSLRQSLHDLLDEALRSSSTGHEMREGAV